ncbi:MAG: hypothetical protein P4M08_16130 [Oligoflexia bacterium]|nr:hypothetical protein [Oligoflexia bacterium]
MAYFSTQQGGNPPGSSSGPSSGPSSGWIHELARGESHPEMDRLMQSGVSDPEQLVEESTVGFLSELREIFNEYTKIFNAYSEGGVQFQEIKVYNVAGTAADFMVFRNQIKLVVNNAAHGVIQFQFSQHVRGALAVDGQAASIPNPAVDGRGGELHAQVGPFRNIFWTFQNEKVLPEQVAKYYFTEFVRATRDNRRSTKGNNQLLIDQIKALLQEKGLSL